MFILVAVLAASCLPAPLHAEAPTRFYIQEYRVAGATKISALEVESAVYPFLGPGRTADDVEQARLALEKTFHNKGFQTVSVLIPQQDPRFGIIRLEVVEGTVARLRINGTKHFLPSKIRAAAPSLAEGGVPNMDDVRRDILALNRLPDRRVIPELKPGATFGTVEIDLNVEDELPLHGSFEINNRYSPDTSALRLNAALSYANLFQLGHTAGISAQIAPENPDDALIYSGFYLARVADSASLMLSATRQDSDVSTLGGGSVVGRGEIYSLRTLFDLPSSEGFFQNFSLGIDAKFFDEDINIAGNIIPAPIEYYPISANYAASWIHSKESFTELNSSLLFHLRGLGSDSDSYSNKRYASDGSFVILRGDASHTRDLKNGSQLFGKIQGQLANKALINTEQLSGGGLGNARGYLEGTALGDNGVFVTAEARSPSFLGKPDQENPRADEWRVHAFADAGLLHIYDALPGQDDQTNFASVGIGTRLRYREIFRSSLDLAVPLTNVPPTDRGDIRVTFRGWAEF